MDRFQPSGHAGRRVLTLDQDRCETTALILVVEDDPDVLAMLETVLQAAGHKVHGAMCGHRAIEALWSEAFDLAIIDIHLPDITGLEVLNAVRERSLDLPAIILSADESIDSAITALRYGAFDFIRKPVAPPAILQVIARALDADSAHSLRHQALHDELTGLANRALLADRLRLMVTQAERTEKHFALLFIDLDRFKLVNDTLGHAVGDGVLRETARRFSLALRAGDTLARWGGDEFVALLPGIDDLRGAQAVGSKLRAAMADPYLLIDGEEKSTQMSLDCSIGAAIYPLDGRTGDQLLHCADLAMFHDKRGDAHDLPRHP